MLVKKLIVLYFLVNQCAAQFLECTSNQDCQNSDAVCEDYLCKCPPGTVFSKDGTKCLPVSLGFNSICEESRQCGWLLGDYDCVDNKCVCANGWSYVMGQCVKVTSLNKECETDLQCYNGYDILAMVCKNNKCVCNDGYYNRDNFDCRPAITAPGEYCSLDSDCKFANGRCQNSYCVKQSATGSSCENCSTTPNAMCYEAFQICYCKRGYYFNPKRKACEGELGTNIGCTKDSECLIPYSRCDRGKCYCRKTYFTLTASSCQKPMTNDHLFCNTPARCYTLGPYSTCEDNQCKCVLPVEPNSAFVCEAPKVCTVNMDCSEIKHSICVDSTCQCPEGYRIEESICVPSKI